MLRTRLSAGAELRRHLDELPYVRWLPLRGLRTGRATPALVDQIRVEYYGSPTPLKQLAQINTPDPQQIVIRPFDASVLKEIEKAIRASDLGLSPNNDGKMIRLTVPPMSGEQRQKMVTRIKKLGEEAKVAIRNVRRDANKHFDQAEKAKEMTEDDCERGKEQVQTLTKQYEEFRRGTVAELAAYYEQNEPRGEIVIVLAGAPEEATDEGALEARAAALRAEGKGAREIQQALLAAGASRNVAYRLAHEA